VLRLRCTTDASGHVPRIVSVVPLLPSLSTERFVLDLLPSLGLSEDEIASISTKITPFSSIVVPAPRFKTTLIINILPALQVYPTLDSALVSDTVILLSSSVDEVQVEGETILRCLQGQAGGVHVLSCVQVRWTVWSLLIQGPDLSAPVSVIPNSCSQVAVIFYPLLLPCSSKDLLCGHRQRVPFVGTGTVRRCSWLDSSSRGPLVARRRGVRISQLGSLWLG